jgi:hypothetical protein
MEAHAKSPEGQGLSIVPTEMDPDEHYGSTLLTEFKRLGEDQAVQAERVTQRAQQIVVFVAAVFAVAQTAALSSFDAANVSTDERHWLLGVAIGAAAMLGLSGASAVYTGLSRRYNAVGPEDITAAAESAAETDEDVAVILAKRYRQQVENGKDVLGTKRTWLHVSEASAIITLVLIVGEIVIALAARLG